jgi:hypothetical protein
MQEDEADEHPWVGVAGTAGGASGGSVLVTACRLALDERVVALVSGRVDCQLPYYAVCVSGEFEDDPAGSVCCDGEEPGSDCEVHEA